MCRAIAECHSVDEVKDLHDKARALEIYAKQAMNVEAERKATEIRLRAERRAGELMAALRRIPPQKANPNGRSGNESPATTAGDSPAGPRAGLTASIEAVSDVGRHRHLRRSTSRGPPSRADVEAPTGRAPSRVFRVPPLARGSRPIKGQRCPLILCKTGAARGGGSPPHDGAIEVRIRKVEDSVFTFSRLANHSLAC